MNIDGVFLFCRMSKHNTRPVGLRASVITGSINSRYRISERWKNTSYDHSDEAGLVHSCQKCEDCSCKKCKDLHKRVSISDTEVPVWTQPDKLDLTEMNSHDIKLPDDDKNCWITGIAITEGNRIIMVDFENRKVKMFGTCMRFVFSLCLQFRPWDIAVIRENAAAVSMSGRQLAIIGTSQDDMLIKDTVKLPFDIFGIAAHEDKLIITSLTSDILSLPSVKLIDTTGRVYWSVPLNHKGRQLFKWPMYVSILNHDSSVVVTDSGNSAITLLHVETGEIIKRYWLPLTVEPQCVTVDPHNNIYISCIGTNEVVVVSKDLSDTQCLLTKRGFLKQWSLNSTRRIDLKGKPWALCYDKTTQQLIVSYDSRSSIDLFRVKRRNSGRSNMQSDVNDKNGIFETSNGFCRSERLFLHSNTSSDALTDTTDKVNQVSENTDGVCQGECSYPLSRQVSNTRNASLLLENNAGYNHRDLSPCACTMSCIPTYTYSEGKTFETSDKICEDNC